MIDKTGNQDSKSIDKIDIEKNYKDFVEKLNSKCIETKRKINEITLVGVTKTKSLDFINKAYSLGINNIGENYVSEITSKFQKNEKRSYKIRMIGHLQTNKVRHVIDYVDSIDSIDSFHLASKLSKALNESNKKMEVLFEISCCDDPEKTGFKNIDELKRTLDFVLKDNRMSFRGFMTIGALSKDESKIRASFDNFLRSINLVENEFPNIKGLYKSFGMTDDWQIAIEMGSNMLRIGRAIFGER